MQDNFYLFCKNFIKSGFNNNKIYFDHVIKLLKYILTSSGYFFTYGLIEYIVVSVIILVIINHHAPLEFGLSLSIVYKLLFIYTIIFIYKSIDLYMKNIHNMSYNFNNDLSPFFIFDANVLKYDYVIKFIILYYIYICYHNINNNYGTSFYFLL